MSAHKWVIVSVDGKDTTVCDLCHAKESDIGSYRASDYCDKTPEAIEHRERTEYHRLIKARDCGRPEGLAVFEYNRERWEHLNSKYGPA